MIRHPHPGRPIQLIIHIGQPKTGSSSIQTTLCQSAQYLAEHEAIWYPICEQGFYSSPESLTDKLAQLSSILSDGLPTEHPIRTIVLSHEGLLAASDWAAPLLNLASELNFEPQIVCYLRRQDIWLESAWKQWGAKHEAFPTLHDYMQVAMPRLNWMEQLRPWLDTFGRDRMTVRRFEQREIGLNVVSDFLQLLGIQDMESVIGSTPLYANRGFTPEVMELITLLKSDRTHDNTLLELFDQALDERYKKQDPFAAYGLLASADRQFIFDECEASNQEVSRMFFDGEWPLFERAGDDESFISNDEERTGEMNMIRILLQIALHQHQRVEKLEEVIREIRG
jgi:hypothetical protein